MCKMCGFADHSHKEDPCTKCPVPRDEMASEESLRNGKFFISYKVAKMILIIFLQEYPPRDGEEHRNLCFQWKALETEV